MTTSDLITMVAAVAALLLASWQYFSTRRARASDALRRRIDAQYESEAHAIEEHADSLRNEDDPSVVLDDYQHTVDSLRSRPKNSEPGDLPGA